MMHYGLFAGAKPNTIELIIPPFGWHALFLLGLGLLTRLLHLHQDVPEETRKNQRHSTPLKRKKGTAAEDAGEKNAEEFARCRDKSVRERAVGGES